MGHQFWVRIVCQLAQISSLIDGSVLNPTAALLNISVSSLFSQIQNKNTSSVFKYVKHLQRAGYDVYMTDVISTNQELISDEFNSCDWC